MKTSVFASKKARKNVINYLIDNIIYIYITEKTREKEENKKEKGRKKSERCEMQS